VAVSGTVEEIVEDVDRGRAEAKRREPQDRLADRFGGSQPTREDHAGEAGQVLDPLPGAQLDEQGAELPELPPVVGDGDDGRALNGARSRPC
jgi:hypothetical protein